MKKQSHFPRGWDEARVKRLLSYDESQTDDEAVAEDEAAFGRATPTAMKVPVALVPRFGSSSRGISRPTSGCSRRAGELRAADPLSVGRELRTTT